MSNGKRISIAPMLAIHFVGTLGFSLVLPFLVFLVTRWGGNALIYGILGATYSSFQLVGAPILGRWSDRYGRRRILLLSQLGTLASWGIFLVAFALPTRTLLPIDSPVLGAFALTAPLLVLFLARALDGVTGGNVSVANAYVADITDDDNRNLYFGRMSVASNLGFILGPAIAGVLGSTAWGELLPVLAAFFISLVASAIIWLKLPESNPCALVSDPSDHSVRKMFGQEPRDCYELVHDKTSLREAVQQPGVPLVLAIHFLVMLGFNFFYVAFPVWAVRGLQWTVQQTGIFFSVLSFTMAVVQGPVLGRASKRFSEITLVLAGSVVLAASFLCFTSGQYKSMYLGAVLMSLGNGVLWPSAMSLLAKRAGARYQGTVQGFASSSGAFASVIGLVVGGLLFDRMGAQIFSVSAATIGVVFLLAILAARRASSA
jgi:MFS family permease